MLRYDQQFMVEKQHWNSRNEPLIEVLVVIYEGQRYWANKKKTFRKRKVQTNSILLCGLCIFTFNYLKNCEKWIKVHRKRNDSLWLTSFASQENWKIRLKRKCHAVLSLLSHFLKNCLIRSLLCQLFWGINVLWT